MVRKELVATYLRSNPPEGYDATASIAQSIYYKWSTEFFEADTHRLTGDTALAASALEVRVLRREVRDSKKIIAEQTLELKLLKKG